MLRKILISVFVTLLVAQLCQADAVDDAEAALDAHRQASIDNFFNRGLAEHSKMSTEVDTVALDTKESGLKALEAKTAKLILQLKKVKTSTPAKLSRCYATINRLLKATADDLEACVNNQAEEAVTLIYTKGYGMADQLMQDIFAEEKEIIFCGRSDEDCLAGVTADINDKTAGVADIVSAEIEVDRQAVDEQIELIKGCAAKAIEKSEGFAKRCVH